MKKVLCIAEDYTEGTRIQTLLKKVGFDATLSGNPARLGDQILNANPDIVMCMGAQKFSSVSVAQKLKEVTSYRGKAVVILPTGERPQPIELAKARVDVLMESPLQAEKLIEVLAKLGQLDPAPFLEKYKKSNWTEAAPPPAVSLGKITEREKPDKPELQIVHSDVRPEASTMVTGNPGAYDPALGQGGGSAAAAGAHQDIPLADSDRVARYQKFVQDMHIDKSSTSHSHKAVKARQNELKKGWDFPFLQEIDKLKRQFAAALFRKP